MAVQQVPRKKRVAIIGSGLAGLSAAHLLTTKKCDDEEGIEVHIFEKANAIGMDSASIDVVGDDGKIHRVDSPMRAVQGGYYTRLLKLYKNLGIELEKSNFTYSFFELSSKPSRRRGYTAPYHRHRSSREDHQHGNTKSHGFVDEKALLNKDNKTEKARKTTTFLYNGGNGISLRPIGFPSNGFSIKYIIRHLYLTDLIYHFYDIISTIFKASFFASCYIYLLFLSFYHVYLGHTPTTSSHPLSKSTLSRFLSTTYLPRSFINEILIPLFACVATCSPGEIMDYPAGEILEYIAKTFGTDHYIVKGGVRNAVQRLLKDLPEENIHLGCELVSLNRLPVSKPSANNGKSEMLVLTEISGKIWEFENVIFATQANQARFLLAGYYKSLRDSESPFDNTELTLEKERLDALGRFSYTQSIVVNHYDSESTLVKDGRDRRILNLARWSDDDIRSSSSKLSDEDEKLDSSKRMKKEYTMATHNLSILHPNCKSSSSNGEGIPLLQTTNPIVKIDDSLIVSSQVFERAILTLDSKDALKGFMKYPSHTSSSSSEEKEKECFQGLGGVYFVGAWAAEGIPLLEGCVVSAERAVKSLCG